MTNALPTPPRATLPPDTAASLAEFARSCKAAARAVSLYPGQHPAIGTSLSRLAEATLRLTADGPLELQVRPGELLISNAGLPKPDQSVRELAELLHQHLIGAMTVNAGADAGSWRTLLLLLSRPPDEVRNDGGIAHLWATAGGPSVEIREVDYAEVLREKRGLSVAIDQIIAAAVDGTALQLDDDSIDALMAMLEDRAQIDELMARLQAAAEERGADAKTVAILALLRTMAERAQTMADGELEATLRKLGGVTARLSADEMLRLLAHRNDQSPDGEVVGAVLDSMEDADVASFVGSSVVAERGATARLAHAFQALVPDTDRRRRIAALAAEEATAAPDVEDQLFEDLFGKVESMVSSYSDTNYVSEEYGRELWAAQTKAVDVEQTADDPPERVAAWLTTVSDAALRGLDHQLLHDLLAIEDDPARWRDVADTAAAHAEDLVRVGYFDQAWELAGAVIRHGQAVAERTEFLPQVLQRLGRGTHMKHVAAHLRSADDAAFRQFQQLCLAIGTPVIAPLAEALSAEQDARSRRRLRDVLVGFGAQGRDVVQQLMSAPNWEVRRTAAFLLREFGGSEGLKELIPLLTDNEPLVQREAVQGLVLNGSTEAAAILVNALKTVSGRTRDTLVAELVAIRDRRASTFFAYLVRHLDRAKQHGVYVASIEALGTFGDTASIDALEYAISVVNWWAPLRARRARAAAAAALRKIGSPEALDALRRAAASRNRGTRAAARAELADLQ